MPDKDGVLSQTERDQVVEWLQEHSRATCSSCGETEWLVGDQTINLIYTIGRGRTYPSVVVVCKTCGLTRLHNAILLGIEKAEEPEESEGE